MHQADSTILVHKSTDKKTTAPQGQPDPVFDRRKWLAMFIAALIVSTIIAFSVMFMSNQFTVAQEKTFILPYYNDNQITLGEGHEIIQRLEWGGQPPLKRKKLLHHPVELVITAHTVTDFCTTIAECSTIVAAIQNYHFTLKKSDITYNFLIGGDGNVYVGRGWDVVNPFRNQSIVISFIGNYLSDQLKEDMIDAAQMLLLQGVEFGKLAENYTIVCHNQTKATLSPGTNVYKIVKTWPHYSPDKIH